MLGQDGLIQIYTGNGKGKTTASLGLAMRAFGRCWKVLIVMFLKGGDDYGELNSFRNLSPEISKNLKDLEEFREMCQTQSDEKLKEILTDEDISDNHKTIIRVVLRQRYEINSK